MPAVRARCTQAVKILAGEAFRDVLRAESERRDAGRGQGRSASRAPRPPPGRAGGEDGRAAAARSRWPLIVVKKVLTHAGHRDCRA